MYELSSETKQAISETVGLPWDTLVNMTIEEEIEYIEKKNGKKLVFAMRPYPNRRSTGNPLIDRYRFFTKEDEEKWFKKLMKRRTR
mgnify:FL=1|jgi:hypothetical protein